MNVVTTLERVRDVRQTRGESLIEVIIGKVAVVIVVGVEVVRSLEDRDHGHRRLQQE
jgi:hypothetical protein